MSGADVWSQLDRSELRKSLDNESLNIIQPLLPDIYELPLPIIDDTDRLGKIYSYLSYDKLFKRNFRKNLFSYFDEEQLIQLMSLLDLNEWERDKMIEALVRIPWNSNDEARIIADFIGMPSWILDLQDVNLNNSPIESIPWICKYESLESNGFKKEEYQQLLAGRPTFKRLKGYQNRVFVEAHDILQKNLSRVLLNMPTGTGKTRTCMELVCTFLHENPNKSVVWLADKVELIDQACLEFHDTWEFLGNRTIPIRRWVADSPIGDEGESEFICATFGTLLSRGHGLKNIDIGLVVVDEAHMAIAPQWRKKMEENIIQMRNSTRLIGLSATPQRSTTKESEELVDFFYNNRLFIERSGNKNLIDWLEENEYLSISKIDPIKAEVEMELTEREIKKIKSLESDIFSESFCKRLVGKVKFNEVITGKIKELLDKNPEHRILYFGTTVKQSKMIMAWLRMEGYTAFHIDSSTDPRIRKNGIEAFRQGKIQVLCNWGVLTTGFDAPKTDVVIIARPTSSPVTYHQMVGRGLRGPKLGGTATCKIIDVDFNLYHHGSRRRQLYQDYRDLWGGEND